MNVEILIDTKKTVSTKQENMTFVLCIIMYFMLLSYNFLFSLVVLSASWWILSYLDWHQICVTFMRKIMRLNDRYPISWICSALGNHFWFWLIPSCLRHLRNMTSWHEEIRAVENNDLQGTTIVQLCPFSLSRAKVLKYTWYTFNYCQAIVSVEVFTDPSYFQSHQFQSHLRFVCQYVLYLSDFFIPA